MTVILVHKEKNRLEFACSHQSLLVTLVLVPKVIPFLERSNID